MVIRKGIVYIASILILCTALVGVWAYLFDTDRITPRAHNISAHISACCVYPFLRLQSLFVAPLKDWWQHKHTIQDLERTLVHVHHECEVLRAENIALRAQHAYAQDIREVADYTKRYEQEAHIAHIMMKHLSDQAHYFLVDMGARDGIHQDMVAVYKNCLVGRVTEVYPWYSKVQLITDASCKVGASCAQSRALGIHRGDNTTDTTALDYVSHLDKVEVGDMLLSSGEGLIFPQGFALGTIATCTPNGLYKKVGIKPLLNLRDLHYCVLLAKGK